MTSKKFGKKLNKNFFSPSNFIQDIFMYKARKKLSIILSFFCLWPLLKIDKYDNQIFPNHNDDQQIFSLA